MLKIAVFGAGGVGGIFGAFLARGGHNVHFIARGEHFRTLRSRGLEVRTPSGHFHLRRDKNDLGRNEAQIEVSETTTDAQSRGQAFDLVLVCVKAWQLAEACTQLAPLVGKKTLILPLLNGVEAAAILRRSFPDTADHSPVLNGFCAVISYIQSPGTIEQVGLPPYLCLGEVDAPHVSERILELKRELSVTGIRVEAPENFLAQLWQKFIFISSLAAVTSAARLPAGPLREWAETRNLIAEAMGEVVALARARGVSILENSVQKAMQRLDEMPAQGTTSMQRDFQGGRPTELETFSGYITREAQKLGLVTPVHRVCYALLSNKRATS